MTDHVSPDYCAHGIGVDLLCEECVRWYKAHFQTEEAQTQVPKRELLPDQPDDSNNGYPSSQTLHCISTVACVGADASARVCLSWAKSAWHDERPASGWRANLGTVSHTLSSQELSMIHAKVGEGFMRFATGGWRGNEDIIAAVKKNPTTNHAWCLSTREGVHIYRYPDIVNNAI